jgi:hypothetical protein
MKNIMKIYRRCLIMLTTLCYVASKKLHPQGWFKKKIGTDQNAAVGKTDLKNPTMPNACDRDVMRTILKSPQERKSLQEQYLPSAARLKGLREIS